ncbi:6-phosphogluconolactonase [Prochlorococcus marinus]|uniref:6-phosphogluconolactonase n=1 Tax=Prochlorococcus marinus XMU1408 TaxID=2213228 RepID=A0A318R028_PROMR|nr:6-phosphogluconolactonase [Prochlorococcus marinus]MBW3041774.1 6-phosphogluconolactonase [Prochlorococcus marinus str. XMU1408]PYE02917.1 6-phosphogluconolactonase [Prochlorococcus marinus XMU1408]
MTKYVIQVSEDKNSLAFAASDLIAQIIESTLRNKSRAKIALCGGSTPKAAYSLIGKKNLKWSNVDLFLGDERWVDNKSQESNCFLINNSLFQEGNPSLSASFFSVSTVELASPEESAEDYETILKNNFDANLPRFDLILLGLGDDGHTASLFPGSDALFERDSLITVGEGKGLKRITFTSKLLSSADNVIFLISGTAKQTALRRLLDKSESWERTPAKLVAPSSEIIVLADKDAYPSL